MYIYVELLQFIKNSHTITQNWVLYNVVQNQLQLYNRSDTPSSIDDKRWASDECGLQRKKSLLNSEVHH